MKRKKKILKIFIVLLFVLFLFVWSVSVYVKSYSSPYLFSEIGEVPDSKVALILGAKVWDDRLSDILMDRAQTGLELYKAGKVEKLLVSGDHGREDYDEVNAVKKYLLEEGVEPEDVFLDHAGFDTYDSLYRARAVFEVDSVIIVTQNFHLPRAVYIGRKLGIDHVSGFSADKHVYVMSAYNDQREMLAKVKAFFNVVFGAKPEFLGEVISVGGDGRGSWD